VLPAADIKAAATTGEASCFVALGSGQCDYLAPGDSPSIEYCGIVDCRISTGTRYITSMYYVLNALEAGYTTAERGFGICPGRRGRLSALRVFLCKSILYGAFVWARRTRKHQKRRFPARAVAELVRDVILGLVAGLITTIAMSLEKTDNNADLKLKRLRRSA
jgi:hypothetical protein